MSRCLHPMHFSLTLLLALALITGCFENSTGDHVEGPGSETETLTGQALLSDGTPASNAIVRLRPRDYLATPSALLKTASNGSSYVDANTDDHGRFRFDSLERGEYRLEFLLGSQAGVLEVEVGYPTKQAPLLAQLRSTGSLRGTLAPFPGPGVETVVQVIGLERAYRIQGDTFFVDELPVGIHDLRFTVPGGSLGEIRLESVAILTRDTTVLSPIRFQVACEDARCDSAIVRNLLDTNGLEQILLSDVAGFDSSSGRLISLHLNEKTLKTSRLNRVPGDIQKLQTLRELDLSEQGLTAIPGELASLTSLLSLRISKNKLARLPPGLASLGHLQDLDVSQNLIEFLPAGLGSLHGLRSLDATENRLTGLPDDFIGVDSLRVLRMRNNELSRVPPEVFTFTNLETLDLGDNFIAELPEALSGLIGLRRLSLDVNHLKEIPARMSELGQLDSLDLARNLLSNLPDTLATLELRQLSLRGNRLCSVTDEITSWADRFDPGWRNSQQCP